MTPFALQCRSRCLLSALPIPVQFPAKDDVYAVHELPVLTAFAFRSKGPNS